MKYVTRLLVWPFVLGILIVAHLGFALTRSFSFIKYGGEWNTYSKEDIATMGSIYAEIKVKNEEKRDVARKAIESYRDFAWKRGLGLTDMWVFIVNYIK